MPLLNLSQVFDEGLVQKLTKKGADHVYNAHLDSALYYADSLKTYIPTHPAVPLMKAIALIWAHIPTISDEVFSVIERQLDSTVFLARQKDPRLKDPEMIFFAMSAYGLLAEYYADKDYTMKAVREAGRAYSLLKQGFDLTEKYPEFLFTTGLYNYFREKYPEKYPIYKPLLWFFRSGDKELGLKQLERAAEVTFLTKVETHVYLSYIYLRYEYKPEKAQQYLSRLCLLYPNNYYAKAKYLESLANPKDFNIAPIKMINDLMNHENDYYKLAGHVFLGYYEEVVNGNHLKAEIAYRKGLTFGEQISEHGEFFKGFGYLGLGRILLAAEEAEEAEVVLKKALNYPETEAIKSEAKELLSQL
ncbi:MAG: hypothetical protein GDA51_05815 [Ekhidna sp.]|nr:hypothetical protein [Ekhidna sp.]